MTGRREGTDVPGLEGVRIAILNQAVNDYRALSKWLVRHAGENSYQFEYKARDFRQCERFFLSTWFATLYDVDGMELLRKLKREAVG